MTQAELQRAIETHDYDGMARHIIDTLVLGRDVTLEYYKRVIEPVRQLDPTFDTEALLAACVALHPPHEHLVPKPAGQPEPPKAE
jgi:hypothetical protein